MNFEFNKTIMDINRYVFVSYNFYRWRTQRSFSLATYEQGLNSVYIDFTYNGADRAIKFSLPLDHIR